MSGSYRRGTTALERFEEKVDRSDSEGCHLWTGSTVNFGYGRLGRYLAHRLSWEHERGPIPEGMWVLHRCDNPPCVRIEHLFLGTHLDNMRDMARKGRRSKIPTSRRIWSSDVEEMRNARSGGMTYATIGARFGITGQHVSRLLAGHYPPQA